MSAQKQKRIGLTMRVTRNQGYNEVRDSISHDWIDLLNAMNYEPILIPNQAKNIESLIGSFALDGIILTGGNTVAPKLIGHPDWEVTDIAPDRDSLEFSLLKHASASRIPVLGVCRGMQIINAYFKGTLTKVDSVKHVAKSHKIRVEGKPWVDILGLQTKVNSFHNYGITQKDLSSDLKPFALDNDGLVEGAAHKDFPIVGIQWHPERPQPAHVADKEIIEFVFSKDNIFDHRKANVCRK